MSEEERTLFSATQRKAGSEQRKINHDPLRAQRER
jgi:hypothetical protein